MVFVRLGIIVLLGLVYSCNNKPKLYIHHYFSEPVIVDKKYKSMQGPISTIKFNLARQKGQELIWLKGFRSVVVNNQNKPESQSFMCHSNLVYNNLSLHRQVLENKTSLARSKLFTISQGEDSAILPEGFGIPLLSTNQKPGEFTIYNQLLSMNFVESSASKVIRYKNTLFYLKNSEVAKPMKALYPVLAQVMVSLNKKNAIFENEKPSEVQKQASCASGEMASDAKFSDNLGQQFSYHWKLKPGRETRKTLISKTMLKLRGDTTIHHIVAHMHPFGESLSLRDLTTQEDVFVSHMKNYTNKLGIAKVEHFTSKKGITIYKNHEYALVSKYNNTSATTHDAMAIMYLFLHDKAFKQPS